MLDNVYSKDITYSNVLNFKYSHLKPIYLVLLTNANGI